MTTPTAGAAFAPVLVHEPPQHAGDALYAIMQNALYSPIAAYASGPARTLPFIMGQLMVFRREALRAVGGVRCAEGQLVDDMAIGQRIHAAGYANVMSRAPLHIATGGMTLAEFIPIFRRWMMFAKNGLPLSFSWRQWAVNLGFWLSLVLALIGFAAGGVWAALPGLGALFAIGASQLVLQQRYGGAPIPPRLWWTGWGVFAVAPYVLGLNLLQKRVDWRGRLYDVDDAAALAAAPAGGPDELDLDGLSREWRRPATEPAQHP